MADELDPVEQTFIADMEPYISAIEDAVHDARDFAEANLAAKAAIDEMRDSAAEAGAAVSGEGDVADATAEELGHLRDEALEAAEATGHLRDESLEAAAAIGAEGLAADTTDAALAFAGFAEAMDGTGGTIAVIIPLLALLAIALGPFLAGLAPVALGVAAFAAGAVPEIEKIWNAVSKGGKAWRDLSPAEKQAGDELKSLKADFADVVKAVRPEVIKGFADALKIVKDLMPAIIPLAREAGRAIDGFLGHIATWLQSSSGQKFIKYLETEGPHALKTFGAVLWDTAQVAGRTFDFLRNAGDSWWRNLHQILHDTDVDFDDSRHAVADWGHNVDVWFDRIRHDAATMGHDVAAAFDQDRHDIAQWAGDVQHDVDLVTGFFRALPGRILGALAALPGMLFSLGERVIDGLWNGIKSAVGGLLSFVSGIAGDISHAFSSVLGIFSPSRVFHQHGLMLMAGLAAGSPPGHRGRGGHAGRGRARLGCAVRRRARAGGCRCRVRRWRGRWRHCQCHQPLPHRRVGPLPAEPVRRYAAGRAGLLDPQPAHRFRALRLWDVR